MSTVFMSTRKLLHNVKNILLKYYTLFYMMSGILKRDIFSFSRYFANSLKTVETSFHVRREMNNNNPTKMKDWTKFELENWFKFQDFRSSDLHARIIKKG